MASVIASENDSLESGAREYSSLGHQAKQVTRAVAPLSRGATDLVQAAIEVRSYAWAQSVPGAIATGFVRVQTRRYRVVVQQ